VASFSFLAIFAPVYILGYDETNYRKGRELTLCLF